MESKESRSGRKATITIFARTKWKQFVVPASKRTNEPLITAIRSYPYAIDAFCLYPLCPLLFLQQQYFSQWLFGLLHFAMLQA